jgi:hypothetical protein
MDSAAVPWIMLASVVVALIAAIAAWVSAYFSSRSSRTAADASRTAANAAESTLVLRFRDEYASDQMLADLRALRDWYDTHGSKFAKAWREKFEKGDNDALIVDKARRRVSNFFSTIIDLHDARLVPERIERLIIDLDGIELLYNVVEPLERELNPNYHKEHFDKLRKLRPSKGLGEHIAQGKPA